MSCGGTPAASAAVAPPMRSECAPYRRGSRPAASMAALTTSRSSSTVIIAPDAWQKRGADAGMPSASRSLIHSLSSCAASKMRPPPATITVACLPRSTRRSFRFRIRTRACRAPSAEKNVTSLGTMCSDSSNTSPRPLSRAISHPRARMLSANIVAARHMRDAPIASSPRTRSRGEQPCRSIWGGCGTSRA